MKPGGPGSEKAGVVTVVIAAYERPQALRNALRSLYRQTWTGWRALVVCDCCTPEFMSQVDRTDERVRYVNLPMRCGHQYGPNSIGMHLTDTEFLAFLNHDDLWLEDHLEIALARLNSEGVEAYLGRAAFCHRHNQPGWPHGPERLMFSELNRPEFLWRSLTGPVYFFEPASAWVVRAEFARKTGPWSPPDEIAVTPVMDWLARLAFSGARFSIGSQVSVLKLNLHHGSKSMPSYHQGDAGQQHFEGMLSQSAEALRVTIAEDLPLARSRGLKVREDMADSLEMTPAERDRLSGFLLYLQTGIQVPGLLGPPIGTYTSRNAFANLAGRTGERLDRFPSVDSILAALASTTRP